jgi:hypothetical protein
MLQILVLNVSIELQKKKNIYSCTQNKQPDAFPEKRGTTLQYLDSVEQVLMMLLQQQTEQMKRQQHLPSNQLKMDQVEEVEMAA